LEAEDMLPIPNAGQVYRGTYAVAGFVPDSGVPAGTTSDGLIESGEISPGEEEIEPNQCSAGTNKQ